MKEQAQRYFDRGFDYYAKDISDEASRAALKAVALEFFNRGRSFAREDMADALNSAIQTLRAGLFTDDDN